MFKRAAAGRGLRTSVPQLAHREKSNTFSIGYEKSLGQLISPKDWYALYSSKSRKPRFSDDQTVWLPNILRYCEEVEADEHAYNKPSPSLNLDQVTHHLHSIHNHCNQQ